MKIAAIADIHGEFEQYVNNVPPGCDCIIVGGDLTNFGFRYPQYREIQEAIEWLTYLSTFGVPVLWIPGNHDIGMKADTFNIPNVKCILERTVLVCGIRVRGVSHCTCYDIPRLANTWAHTSCDSDLEQKKMYTELLEANDEGTLDIIVSHSPPYECLDSAGYDLRKKENVHIGSAWLKRYVVEEQPDLVICGHCHEAAGEAYIDDTLVVNTAGRWSCIKMNEYSAIPSIVSRGKV